MNRCAASVKECRVCPENATIEMQFIKLCSAAGCQWRSDAGRRGGHVRPHIGSRRGQIYSRCWSIDLAGNSGRSLCQTWCRQTVVQTAGLVLGRHEKGTGYPMEGE